MSGRSMFRVALISLAVLAAAPSPPRDVRIGAGWAAVELVRSVARRSLEAFANQLKAQFPDTWRSLTTTAPPPDDSSALS